LLSKFRDENNENLSDLKKLLGYDADLASKCRDTPFGKPDEVDGNCTKKATASTCEMPRHSPSSSSFRDLRHNDSWTRNRFKFQLLHKLNKLNKRGIRNRKNEAKPESGSDLSSDSEIENDFVLSDYYSSVFHGTTIEMLQWNTKKLETDILEEKHKLIIDELDLHSADIDLLREEDHEIEKVKIRKKIRAKLDDNARKIYLKAKKIRYGLKSKSGLVKVVKEQVLETWQKKKQQHSSFFQKESTETENSDVSSSNS